MTDYEADHDGDQCLDPDIWEVELWGTGQNQGLLRFALWVSAIAVAGYLLTHLLLT